MNISLLPPEIKAQEATRQKMEKVIAMAVLILLICLGVLVFLLMLKFYETIRINGIQSDKERIEMTIKTKYQKYADLKGRIEAANSTLLTAMAANPDWDMVLTEVKNTMPPTVTVDSLDIQNGSSMVLRGTVSDLPTFTRWINGLKETTYISNPRFHYASNLGGGSEGRAGFLYEIQVNIKPGESYQPAWEGRI
ncbi:MAG: PilN domain-containing protein [Candidatus Saccharibacteria bacterium]